MLSQRKVICTQDVIINNNLLYYLLDLNIGLVQKESADKLIKILDVLKEDKEIESTNNEDLFDTVIDLLDSTRISILNFTELEELLEEQLR